MAFLRFSVLLLVFVAACDAPLPPRERPPFRDFAACADVHPRSPTPALRTCELPGANPILVDVSIDPSHCGACFRACAGCTAGTCPSDVPTTVRVGSSNDDVLRDVAAMPGRVAIAFEFGLPEPEGDEFAFINLGEDLVASRGASDGSVVVYDAALRELWSLTVGGEGRDEVRRVAFGRDGSVAIAGSFWRDAQLDSSHILAGDERDGFVALIASDGRLIWTQTIGGAADERVTALAFDEAGGLLIGGASTGRELRVGADTVRGPGDHVGAWIASLTSGGAFRWARAFGGEPNLDAFGTADDSTVNDIAVSRDGLVVAVGYVGQNADFGDGPQTTMGAVDGFVTAMDADGTFRWVRSPYARTTSDYMDRIRALDDGTFVINGGGPLRDRDLMLRSGLMRMDAAGSEVALEGNELVPGTDELRQQNMRLLLPDRTAASGGIFFAADSVTRMEGSRGDVTAPDIVLTRIPCVGVECEPVWLPERCDVTPVTCGDGVNNLNEFCDRGDENGGYGAFCAFDCLRGGGACGDRIVQPEHEECDGGSRADGTRCDRNTCRWGPANVCGDGVRGGMELCFPTTVTQAVALIGEPISHVTADTGYLLATRGSATPNLTLFRTAGPPSAWTVLLEASYPHPVQPVVVDSTNEIFITVGGDCDDCTSMRELLGTHAVREMAPTPGWTTSLQMILGAIVAHDDAFTYVGPLSPTSTRRHARGPVRMMAEQAFAVLVLHDRELTLYDNAAAFMEPRWSVPVDASAIDAITFHDLDGDGSREVITFSGDPAVTRRYDANSGEELAAIPLPIGRVSFARPIPLANLLVVADATGLHGFLPGATDAAWTSTFACTPRDISFVRTAVSDVLYVATDCGVAVIENTP